MWHHVALTSGCEETEPEAGLPAGLPAGPALFKSIAARGCCELLHSQYAFIIHPCTSPSSLKQSKFTLLGLAEKYGECIRGGFIIEASANAGLFVNRPSQSKACVVIPKGRTSNHGAKGIFHIIIRWPIRELDGSMFCSHPSNKDFAERRGKSCFGVYRLIKILYTSRCYSMLKTFPCIYSF